MAGPYNYTTLATVEQELSNRLYDSTQQFWTPAELLLYIQESLLTWNALTSYWRSDFLFPAIPLTFWYDLTQQTNSLVPFTITDAQLYQLIQYHLLEPAVGINPWTGVSTQFTADDLLNAVQRRRDELLSTTNCTQTRRLVTATPGRISLANMGTSVPELVPLASDNFTRPNENPLNLASWTVFPASGFAGGALQILSDRCCATVLDDCFEIFTGVAFSADQWAQITLGAMGTTGEQGIIVRGLGGNAYLAFVLGPLGIGVTVELTVDVAGSLSLIGSFTGTINIGDTILLSAVGQVISVYHNGSLIIQGTDASLASGSPGVLVGTSGVLTDTSITSFSAGVVVSGVGTIIDIRRMAYLPVSNGIPYGTGLYGKGPYGAGLPYLGTVVWPDDSWSEQSFNRDYTISPAGTPQIYLQSTQPPISFDTDVPPAFGGQYELLTSESGPALLATNPQTLLVPDNWVHLIKWGALADLLSRESNAKDMSRAEYCNMRYQMGIALLAKAPQLVQMRLNNVPLQIDSVRSADLYQTLWQSKPAGSPIEVLHAGMNLVALNPVPDSGVYSLTATVVQTAPLPVLPSDPVQVSPDDLDVIIDYAQHLAAFKLGGSEFSATIPLFKRFLRQASVYGLKLAEIAEYTSVIYAQSAREKEQNPLMAPTSQEAD